MAYLSLNQYLNEIDEALRAKDGEFVAGFLSIQHIHAYNTKIVSTDPESNVRRIFESPWDEVILQHIRCLQEIRHDNYVEAFKCQFSLTQTFTKILQGQKEENWALPIMYTLCLDLRNIAEKADMQQKNKDKPHELLEKGADILMGFFRICVGDNRTPEKVTKRWGILNLTNQLFKIYFKVNKLDLLKPLIRVIESSNLKDQYPIAQRVTYKYFVGQQQMFQNQFKLAEENLTFAYVHCHKESKKNKRLILIFLITVKMVMGVMPSMALLQKYDLMQFAELIKAVKKGDPQQFEREVEASFFYKWGIRLILEKLQNILYRNLFKKVYLLMSSHIVPISAFKSSLNMGKKYNDESDEEDKDVIGKDEVMGLLSTLIYENKIKGYISFEHLKVVFSKQNPFPALAAAEVGKKNDG